MKTIDRRITENLRRNGMLEPGDSVLCALSGGADSMCLLHWLKSHEKQLGIRVCAAHYEHGLRGAEALRDAEFAQKQCERLSIPFCLEHGDVRLWAEKQNCGIEEAARTMRYRFLETAAEKLGCNKIATAHNAEDNAETVLFHLVRGSGTAGLGGIPPVRGKIIRPLLEVSRKEIEAYLAEENIPHIEDSSNAEDCFSRNYLRHHVLPELWRMNPSISDAFARAARLLRSDEDCLQQMAKEFLAQYPDDRSVPALALTQLHPAVASRAVRILAGKALEAQHVEAVLALSKGTERAELELPGLYVKREQGKLYFSKTRREPTAIVPRKIEPGAILEIPEAGVQLFAHVEEFHSQKKEIHDLFKTYYFKSDNICGNITVTGHLPGDRMRPFGRNCTKTLRQLFREAKYTEQQRAQTLILRDEKGILAAVGLAVDERGHAAEGDRVLQLDIFPQNNSEETCCD